ncbi:MAG: hypothetical protein JXQ73_23075 [Phycisphaerae bacterium]|nr:hypothetical protein [Phycisphaerae bacterium]
MIRWKLLMAVPGCALLVGLSACGRVDVRVNTFLSSRLAFPEPGAATIHVFAETHPRNELFESEVVAEIERLLRDRGYAIATDREHRPDYVIACLFGTDGGVTCTGTNAVHEPSYFSTTRYYTSCGDWVTARTYVPGRTRYVPYNYTVFDRRLALYLYKGEVPTTTQLADAPSLLVWQATTESSGRSPDLRRVVPCLLVAAFEYWGEDSGLERREGIKHNDKRVTRLHSADESEEGRP